uniref:Uncharacterized protein n=1 Tax=Physcomitrium patens TaxID=3218 RepID=A0A2K1INK7_PHYPA|nr:hypothetical protein PHYPA_027170 [Physcomitrium patens]
MILPTTAIWSSGYSNGEVPKCRYFFSSCGHAREEKLSLHRTPAAGGRVASAASWLGISSDGIVAHNQVRKRKEELTVTAP